jgi:linoleoyl-CoA desaturase
MSCVECTSPARERLASLRAEVRRRGWLMKPTGRLVAEFVGHAVVALAGIAMLTWARTWATTAAGLALATAGSLGVATHAHGSSHYATSDRRWVNELLTYIGYPCFLQLSATYWWRKHVTIHHNRPNVVGVDEDIDLAPWFVLTPADFERTTGFGHRYYRVQTLLLPVAIAAIGFHMHVAGWKYVIASLARPSERRLVHWIDGVCLMLHIALWIALPSYFVGPSRALLTYVARIAALNVALFCVLAPAHLPAEALFLDPATEGDDFVWRQTATTVNYDGGWVARVFCAGLQYQIEHHLFPTVSHVHYPRMQPLVREFCARHGYPYRVIRWPAAIWKSLRVFATLKPMGGAAAARPERPL